MYCHLVKARSMKSCTELDNISFTRREFQKSKNSHARGEVLKESGRLCISDKGRFLAIRLVFSGARHSRGYEKSFDL